MDTEVGLIKSCEGKRCRIVFSDGLRISSKILKVNAHTMTIQSVVCTFIQSIDLEDESNVAIRRIANITNLETAIR